MSHIELIRNIKMKNKKYHTVSTDPKSNRKNIIEIVKIDTANTQIYDRSLT
jgi:hypothetical protein